MNKIMFLFIFAFLLILFSLFIFHSVEAQAVDVFSIRIADFMIDITYCVPNLDESSTATHWNETFTDLIAASSNNEITHVQLRNFWRVDPNNRTSWEYPEIGANSPSQQQMTEKWKSWIFGDPEPTFGPPIAKRIHDAGFQLEFCLSTTWNPNPTGPLNRMGTLADVIPVWYWDGRESDYNFNGELFLENYKNNVVIPIATFLANNPNFHDGDILMLAFEMVYPTADFTWLHNQKWSEIISETRQIFINAGKPNVLLTVDHSSSYNDFGLGYNAVKILDSDAPITSQYPGISGASYLGELDFISLSFWNKMLLASQYPYHQYPWSDDDIPWVTESWYNDMNFCKVGTGYGASPCERGRDYISDLRALSQVMGKKILMNTGYRSGYGELTRSLIQVNGEYKADLQEQFVAWVAQLKAISDPRSQIDSWCAGQDFERYCRDKATQPEYIDASWRNSPAQDGIMNEIRNILGSLDSNRVSAQGRLLDKNNQPVPAKIIVYQNSTNIIINSVNTNSSGYYSLQVPSGTYDIQFNFTSIPNYFIKLNSLNLSSDRTDILNYINYSSQRISFYLDIDGSQGIETYSSSRPSRVLKDGTVISNVSSPANLRNNTWFFQYQNNRLHVLIDSSPSLSKLHTEGNHLVNEAGKTIVLRGLDYTYFVNNQNAYNGDWMIPDGSFVWDTWSTVGVQNLLDFFQASNANVVRVFMTVEYWLQNTGDFQNHIKYFITEAAKRGIYTDLTFWNANGTGQMPNGVLPWQDGNGIIKNSNDFVSLWENVSTTLKDYPSLIFELWNEPNGDSTAETLWFNVAQQCINRIRSVGASQPILIHWNYQINYDFGGGWHYGMDWVFNNPLYDSAANLIYSTHIYSNSWSGFYNATSGTMVTDYSKIDYALTQCRVYEVSALHPIFIGEIGNSLWDSTIVNGARAQDVYYNNTLTLLDLHGIGYAAFAAPPWSSATQWGLVQFAVANYTLNSAGQIFINHLGGKNYSDWINAHD